MNENVETARGNVGRLGVRLAGYLVLGEALSDHVS